MNAWIDAIRGLFVFRSGPADLPYAPGVLFVLFIAIIATDVASANILLQQPGDHLARVLSQFISMMLVFALLRLNGKTERFVQTASALLLVRLAMAVVTLAVLAPGAPYPLKPPEMRPEQALLVSATLPALIWYAVQCIRVLRLALDVSWLRGFIALVALTMMQIVLAALVFPVKS